jgi:hypothetical protein
MGHFLPEYLFLKGDANPIHHPPGTGQLLWIDAFYILFGLFCLAYAILYKSHPTNTRLNRILLRFTDIQKKGIVIILLWTIIGALPAALTVQDMGSANSMRGILSLPAWIIISSLGLSFIFSILSAISFRHHMLIWLFVCATIANSLVFLEYYFTRYPIEHARAFEYGIQQSMDYVLGHKEEYNRIVLTDWISQPHIFAVFFSKYDPSEFHKYQAEYSTKLSAKLESWGQKYMMGDVEKIYYEVQHGLFIARPHMLPDVEPVRVIYHPDGSLAFKIISK